MTTPRTLAPLLLAALLAASGAAAGRWIVPEWPAGQEPRFEPVHLYWFVVKECPLLYRTQVKVPEGADRATALLRTSGYAYVCVDGRQVYAWAPRPKTKDQPEVPADPDRVHPLDLSAHLAPGEHVLTVSAPAEGFVLDGGLYAGAKRVAPLVSDETWTVTKFAPTTLVEDEAILRLGYRGPGARVKAVARGKPDALDEGKEWRASEDALAKAYFEAFTARCREDLDDATWRLRLLVQKGIAIAGDAALGWGGPRRLDPTLLRQAEELLKHTGATSWGSRGLLSSDYLEQLEKRKVESARALEEMHSVIAAARKDIDGLLAGAAALSARGAAADEAKALSLVSRSLAGPWPAAVEPQSPRLAAIRAEMEKQLGHPLPRLNESRYDRLGWIGHPHLVDSDLGRWGVRVNPVTGPTRVGPAGEWRRFLFSTDPKDAGVGERRWSIGYNIEGQWPRIDPTQGWDRDPRFKDYQGFAWYRTRIHIPAEWAGNPVVLTCRVGGSERLWWNSREATKHGTGQGQRTYQVPANLVAFGAENVLAFRIQAGGAGRGLLGPTQAACPALDGPEGKATPPTDVLATPLSPCVVLTPRTDVLQIHHPGKARLVLPAGQKSGFFTYQRDEHGPLKANWALLFLRPTTAASPERPILLVFQHQPLSIVGEAGVTRIQLAGPRRRVIAVRPFVKLDPKAIAMLLDPTAAMGFWSRAALAVPVNYMSITRVARPGEPTDGISIANVPRGPVLGHTVVYDYLETQDDWGTKPLRVAPLPALCSFALDGKFRTLKLGQEIEVIQDGGLLASYRGVKDADHVSYAYEVEPWPRLAGFTSWMFAGSDVGVFGNQRELELIAATGANSYRPQHNFSTEKPPEWMDPGDGRNRLQILVDACNAVGVNYTNNIDQTLGRKREFVREHYDEFIELVCAHHETLARQLAPRPFWAVAYDLINEPFDHHHTRYNPAMKKLTARLRAIDKTHLCYVEPCEAWGAIQQLRLVEPTGDPLTVYSFHDYNFRLHQATDRWPTPERDITNIFQMWLPAIEFQIRHGVGMHCGEFGGHHAPSDDSLAQTLLMNDFFRIFDQFGMHHHYYTGRGVYQRLADGSLRPSNVIRAYRAYFRRPDFNLYYPRWPGHPKPARPQPDH